VLVVALAAAELPARGVAAVRGADGSLADWGWQGMEPPTLRATAVSETGGGSVSSLTIPPPPGPPPIATPGGDGGDDDGSTDDGDGVRVVERVTIWKILFPYETLGASIKAALGEMVMEAARDIGAEAIQGITNIARTVLGDGDFGKGLRQVRQDVWRVGIVIAGILLPFSFMASVVAAMKDGTSSVTGYASAREAMLNWVIAAGAAVSSYFLLDKAMELSRAAMGAIFEGLLGVLVDRFELGSYFMGLLGESAFMATPTLLQVFLAIFGILLALALVAAIGLAFLAREVILVLAVGVAPVMLVMGSVGPLRWINGLWMKVTTIALLLGPANAFLIGAGAMLALNARQSSLDMTGFGGRVLGYLVALGVISVLIGLNSMIGKMVYGAAIEIAEKAANGIMVAVGAVAGLGAMGALGGAGVAASSAGGAAAGSMGSAAGGIGSMAQASSAARAVGSVGQAAAAMGLPGGRGLAAGVNAGASVGAHQQVKQGIADAAEAARSRGGNEPWTSTAFSVPEAVATGGAQVMGEVEARGEKGTLGSMGVPMSGAEARVSASQEVYGRLMTVGQEHNVDMLGGMRQMGVQGPNAQEAVTSFVREGIRQMSFGGETPFRPVHYSGLPRQMTARDLDTAAKIMTQAGTGNPVVPSSEFIDSLAQTAFHRRVQLSEDPNRTIREASQAANLQQWMVESYARLPDKGLADGLKTRLGL